MTNIIDNIYGKYEPPAGSGGRYLRLQDGESAKLRIASEPFVYDHQFGDGPVTTRYAWLVWNYDTKSAQVWQAGVTFYKQLKNLAVDEDWGDPMGYDIKIAREGSGTDTKYHVNPLPRREELSSEATAKLGQIDVAAAVNGIPLSQFMHGTKPPAAPSLDDAPPLENYDQDLPF